MKKIILFLSLILTYSAYAGVNISMNGSRLEDLTRPSTIAEYRADFTDSSGNLVDISGHEKTMTIQNGPASYRDSPLQKNNGYRYTEVSLLQDIYYSRAADGDFDIWEGDHTVTIYFKTGPSDDDYIFQSMQAGVGAFSILNEITIAGAQATYYNGAATIEIDSGYPSAISYKYGVVQVVRSGNTAKCCFNQYCSAWTDVTGYGVTTTPTTAIGATAAGTDPLNSSFVYVRVDAEALSDDELNKDFMTIMGVLAGPVEILPFADFTRSTPAYLDVTNTWSPDYRAPSLVYKLENVPRVGGEGGGVLIEGQTTYLIGWSEQVNLWTISGGTVTANQYYAPNGTLTADKVDNTAAANNQYAYLDSTNLGSLTGRKFTFSIWARADSPRTSSILITEKAVSSNITSIAVTPEWQRFSMTRTCVGGGAGNDIRYGVYGGQSGVSTGITYYWGATMTENAFSVSYVETPARAQVVRTADSLTFDPHPEDSRDLIPYTFSPDIAANKLTVYLEAKCEWSGVADIGISRTIIEIGGNTGVSSGVRNRIYATVDGATADIYFAVWDDTGTPHFARLPGGSLDHSEWFSIRGIIDFEDLSNLDLYVSQTDTTEESNAGVVYFGNTGTAELNTEDSLIRIGQQYDGTVDSFCRFKNLRIEPRIILP